MRRPYSSVRRGRSQPRPSHQDIRWYGVPSPSLNSPDAFSQSGRTSHQIAFPRKRQSRRRRQLRGGRGAERPEALAAASVRTGRADCLHRAGHDCLADGLLLRAYEAKTRCDRQDSGEVDGERTSWTPFDPINVQRREAFGSSRFGLRDIGQLITPSLYLSAPVEQMSSTTAPTRLVPAAAE